MKFEPISVCKYETNGEREVIYGFHHFCVGFISDVIHLKAEKAYHGNEGYKRGIKESIATPKAQGLTLAYLPKDKSDADAHPGRLEEIPETWQKSEDHYFNFLWVNFPVFVFDNEVTRKLSVGDNFGELVMCKAENETGDHGSKACNEFREWLGNTVLKDNETVLESKADYKLANGWRITVPGGKSESTKISVDGELFNASEIHCTFLKERNVLQACQKKKF